MNTYTIEYFKQKSFVQFGCYLQDMGKHSPAAPLDWRVLSIDEHKCLLLSNKVLDSRIYGCGENSNIQQLFKSSPVEAMQLMNTATQNATWEDSNLRKWLNTEFYNTAFSDEEKRIIAMTEVATPNNPQFGTKGGLVTTDKIFLLSVQEVLHYLPDAESRKAVPTDYAISHGIILSQQSSIAGLQTCWWMLRTPGEKQNMNAGVLGNGEIGIRGHNILFNGYGVRPALYINFDALKRPLSSLFAFFKR